MSSDLQSQLVDILRNIQNGQDSQTLNLSSDLTQLLIEIIRIQNGQNSQNLSVSGTTNQTLQPNQGPHSSDSPSVSTRFQVTNSNIHQITYNFNFIGNSNPSSRASANGDHGAHPNDQGSQSTVTSSAGQSTFEAAECIGSNSEKNIQPSNSVHFHDDGSARTIDVQTAAGYTESQSTLQSSLIVSTHEDEGDTSVVQTVADIEYSRRNFTPTPGEVPDIDIESDDESAMTNDVLTVTGYMERVSSRPFSFYSVDDRIVNLLVPADDGDSVSTVFHSMSESIPAFRAMTSTVEDFHSISDDTYMSSVRSECIMERPLTTSPETSPPIPATIALSNEQKNTETRIETYNSSFTTSQSVQGVCFIGSSAWERSPSALFASRQLGNNNTKNGKRKSVGTTETFSMKRV